MPSLTTCDLKEAELQGRVYWIRHSITSVRLLAVWTWAVLREPAKKLAFSIELLCSESAWGCIPTAVHKPLLSLKNRPNLWQMVRGTNFVSLSKLLVIWVSKYFCIQTFKQINFLARFFCLVPICTRKSYFLSCYSTVKWEGGHAFQP